MAESIKKLGKYTISEQLGSGAFGWVYKANDPVGRTVAIKVLKPGWADDPQTIERFRREAQVAGELFHPRIATILDFDESDGRMFLVMRYVDGSSLDKLIRARGQLAWAESLGIMSQVADGLDYAHQQGFVHRDVKPANILLGEKAGAVLTDFGLVKAAEASGASTSGAFLGTPFYIAPEIWSGKPASPATDIYSLACVLYEMLTGLVLFDGQSTPEVITKHTQAAPPLPERWPADVPAGLNDVLKHALEKDPTRRYQNVLRFVDDLKMLEKKAGKPVADTAGQVMNADGPADSQALQISQALSRAEAAEQALQRQIESQREVPHKDRVFKDIRENKAGETVPDERPFLARFWPVVVTIGFVVLGGIWLVTTQKFQLFARQAEVIQPQTTQVITAISTTPTRVPIAPAAISTPNDQFPTPTLAQPQEIEPLSSGKIAFVSNNNKILELNLLEPKSKSILPLKINFTGIMGRFVWSPDGTKILYSNDSGLSVLDINRNQTNLVSESDLYFGFTWAPSGSAVAFGNDKGVYLIDIDTKNYQLLASLVLEVSGVTDSIAWSADNRLIALSAWEKAGDTLNLYFINPDGSNLRNISTLNKWARNDGGETYNLAWSPNSSYLAAMTESAILLIGRDGISKILYARQSGFDTFQNRVSWSPDSKSIIFNDVNNVIRIYDIAGETITQMQINGKCPNWSADGKSIIFVAPGLKGDELYLTSERGTEKLTENMQVQCAKWQP